VVGNTRAGSNPAFGTICIKKGVILNGYAFSMQNEFRYLARAGFQPLFLPGKMKIP